MEVSVLASLLLLLFSVPVIVKYRLLPVSGDPYWLFGLLFLLLGANLFAALFPSQLPSWLKRLKISAVSFWLVFLIVLVGSLGTAIVDRGRTAPGGNYGVHDIVLQTEAALRYLSAGKNPYKETYFETELAKWEYREMGNMAVNPALYHFVMPPWYLIFPYPVYAATSRIIGYFDARMPLLLTLIGSSVVLWFWFRHKSLGQIAILATTLAPTVASYHLEGRSDGFALFWFIWAMYLFDKRKYAWGSLLLALAVASKQTIWFAVPFSAYYLWLKIKGSLPKFIKYGAVFLLVLATTALPFILWDGQAFADSVVFYLSGNTANSYPISGYGLSMLLYSLGIIGDIHAFYPFIVWQAIFALPVYLIMFRVIRSKPEASRTLLAYGVGLFVVWYFSRYFNNSHLSYVATLISLGSLKAIDEKSV